MRSKVFKATRFLLDRLPYVRDLRQQTREAGSYPAGHFHSPIPARDEVMAGLQSERNGDLPGIQLNIEQQFERLQQFQAFYKDLPFSYEQAPDTRYYYNQSFFCYPDAIFLYSFLRHIGPQRIIEVGSGFSSAVMLDTVDRYFKESPEITLIEPFPSNLRRLLRPQDEARITVIEQKVQQVPVQRFDALRSGDLLSIDSSHVVKYGSDVHFLMFEVLPRLAVGVFVHVHDVFRSFEYPAEWLLDGRYWNEGYLLRAFLAYNNAWEVYFFNNYVGVTFKEFLAEKMPLCLKDVGGSLYLRRIA